MKKTIAHLFTLTLATFMLTSCFFIKENITTQPLPALYLNGQVPAEGTTLTGVVIDSLPIRATEVWQYHWFKKQPKLDYKIQQLADKVMMETNAIAIYNPSYTFKKATLRTRTLYLMGNMVYYDLNVPKNVTPITKKTTSNGNLLMVAIEFPFNSDEILPQSRLNVKLYSELIKQMPEQQFEIVGYADKNTGSWEYNTALSKRRAESVMRQLQEYGVNEKQVSIMIGDNNEAPYSQGSLNYVVIIRMAGQTLPKAFK